MLPYDGERIAPGQPWECGALHARWTNGLGHATDIEREVDLPMQLSPDEPPAGPWHVTPIRDLVRGVLPPDRRGHHRPWIVAVDGRSGSGKSTLAALLHALVPASALVHTDDVAWHHSFFDWSALLIAGVLEPLHNGDVVHYRPPGWDTHGRTGAIEVAAGLNLVVVEGVGASRTELLPWIDRAIWVQSDFEEAERRGIARDGGTAEARRFWQEWMAAEGAFLHQQRPWERATAIVNGTPTQPYDRHTEIVVSCALQEPTAPTGEPRRSERGDERRAARERSA